MHVHIQPLKYSLFLLDVVAVAVVPVLRKVPIAIWIVSLGDEFFLPFRKPANLRTGCYIINYLPT